MLTFWGGHFFLEIDICSSTGIKYLALNKTNNLTGNYTSKIVMRKVLIDLLLSITVSLPTSRRPICLGSTPYFSRRFVTTVKLEIKTQMSNGDIFKIKAKLLEIHTKGEYINLQLMMCRT